MKSKEAFKKICKNLNSYEFTDEFKRAKNQIIRDLDILKILKKRPALLCCFAYDGIFTWDDYKETYCDEDKQYIGATKGEFEKVKEWLNNDN